jgi:uncharacterized cupin superfamily protein
VGVRYQTIINEQKVQALVSSIKDGEWVPFVEAGQNIGRVQWLRVNGEGESLLATGFWHHTPEEHPDGMLYEVKGNETFHVLKGKAELHTKDGKSISLETGDVFTASNGFEATWKTLSAFTKFFVVSE